MSKNFNYILIYIFFFVSFFNFVQTELEVKSLPGQRFSSENEINEFLNKTDVTCLAFFYKKKSPKANEIAKSLKVIYQKLKYLMEFIIVSCDSNNDVEGCKLTDEDDEDDYYRIEFYVPPQYKVNPYTKEKNTYQKLRYAKSDVSEKAIYKFFTKLIISREQVISNENYDIFKQRNEMNKVLLFTNKRTSPLMFRGLSGYFYDRLLFGVVPSSETALIKKLNVKNFPTLMIIQTLEDGVILDEPNIIVYDGVLDVENIIQFLNQYALGDKLYMQKIEKVENDNYYMYFNKLPSDKAMDFLTKKKEKEVIFYFDNNVKDGKITYDNLPNDVKDFNSETHGFFHFGYIDCTGSKEKICKHTFKIKEFPSMVLYRPSNDQKDRIAKGQELPMEKANIRREISLLFEPNVKGVDSMNFQVTMADVISKKKTCILYLFDTSLSLGFSLITLNKDFTDYFEFIVMDNPPNQFLMQFQSKSLPHIVIIIPDPQKTDSSGNPQTQMMSYMGQQSFSALNSFLATNFHIKKKETEKKEEKEEEDDSPAEVSFIQTTKDLVQTCTKKKLCILGFFDMRPNEKSQENFEKNFKIFQNFADVSKKRPTTFGYINATCQEEFTSKFGVNIESLPSIIVYSYNKDVYSNLVGTFSVEDMTELITKTISGKINFQRVQKDTAVLEDIKCENIQPIVETDEDDDELMKEIIAEEKKKREAFEKQRDKDDKKKKKKKKNKKKDKNTDL